MKRVEFLQCWKRLRPKRPKGVRKKYTGILSRKALCRSGADYSERVMKAPIKSKNIKTKIKEKYGQFIPQKNE